MCSWCIGCNVKTTSRCKYSMIECLMGVKFTSSNYSKWISLNYELINMGSFLSYFFSVDSSFCSENDVSKFVFWKKKKSVIDKFCFHSFPLACLLYHNEDVNHRFSLKSLILNKGIMFFTNSKQKYYVFLLIWTFVIIRLMFRNFFGVDWAKVKKSIL